MQLACDVKAEFPDVEQSGHLNGSCFKTSYNAFGPRSNKHWSNREGDQHGPSNPAHFGSIASTSKGCAQSVSSFANTLQLSRRIGELRRGKPSKSNYSGAPFA